MKTISTPVSKPWVRGKSLFLAFFSLVSAGLLAMNPPSSDNRVVAMSPGLLFGQTLALDGVSDSIDSSPDSVPLPDEFPLFRGGNYNGARDFIKNSLKYPPIAIEDSLQGIVWVNFYLDESGSVKNPRVSQFSGYVLDSANFVSRISTKSGNIPDSLKDAVSALEQEALRVIGSIEGFSPGKKDGKAVRVPFLWPVHFRLFNPKDYKIKDPQPSLPSRMIDIRLDDR